MGEALKGKVAVVTGSGQGIGMGIAIALAQEGARVVTNNRRSGSTGNAILTDAQVKKLDKEKREWFESETKAISGDAETTAKTIRDAGGEAVAFFADITDFDAAGKLIQTAIDSFGRIDILVNVAGAFGFSPIEKMSEELFDRVTAVKPKGYFNTIRHTVPHMIKQKWGRILNCTSRAYLGDVIKHSEYCVANAGVVGLTRAVAIELREYGITCNAFSPWAKTRASYELEVYPQVVGEEDYPFVFKRTATPSDEGVDMLSMTPGPEYAAPFICYLASDAAAKISGSVFSVGGNSIGLYSDPTTISNITKFGEGPWTMEELMQQVPRGLLAGYKSLAEHPFG
jgi:3-oxoacyl-[acyl-carrier protein] reductase